MLWGSSRFKSSVMLRFILSNAMSFSYSVGRHFILHISGAFQFLYSYMLLKPTQAAVTAGWSCAERKKLRESGERNICEKEPQSCNPEKGHQADVCVRKGVSRALSMKKWDNEKYCWKLCGWDIKFKSQLVLKLSIISSCSICNNLQQCILCFSIGKSN